MHFTRSRQAVKPLYAAPEAHLPNRHDETRRRDSLRLVYKKYRYPREINSAELEERISFLRSLDDDARSKLLSIAAWPLMAVECDGDVCGYLMAEAPDKYRILVNLKSGPKVRVAELQYLLNPEPFLSSLGINITDQIREEIINGTVDALAFLHDNGIAVGDFSAKNVLYSARDAPRTFFLHCDSMRFRGRDVYPQIATPNWHLPAGEPNGTPAGDIYKVGLLTLRLYSGSQDLGVLDRARLPTG